MALSQLQCLDDNHVNPRTNESKPEFLYCEDQRLALEALLRGGREAFFKYLEARGLRGFLSDPELETLGEAVEPFDPGSELFPDNAKDGDPPLSLCYWPELSDTTAPRMDLGWPHSEAYRGVTRTTIYSQPPLDGQTHIKETVRKMIAQAQKVIAVVMDVFTDVDIFRDLLDAGFKRRVSVYILLERTTLPHFLAMCQRANMHAGHLKHLRVRCSEGVQFHTRSSTKVRGRMGHRFMFIDGDKAVSGSYSFTWMSSRLDRNLITVITGQAVEAFDRLFHVLYLTSSFVDLRQVAKEPEPVQDPLPQSAPVTLPSVTIARKLYNPKYVLALGNSSSTLSADHNIPQNTSNHENSKNSEDHNPQKRKQRTARKESFRDAPPIHPGLTNLEKACLISYLPTWPEPDPPSDVIGFINIRDTSKPPQVHLQRSEMFETSQAIRFSSPFSMPQETLSEVAKPRELSARQELNEPAQDKTKADESVMDGAQLTQLSAWPDSKAKATETKSPASGLNTEDTLHSNAPISQHSITPQLHEHKPAQSNSNASTLKIPSLTKQAVPANNPTPECLTGPNTGKGETGSKTQRAYGAQRLPTTSGTIDSNTGKSKERLLSHTESHMQAVQPQNFTCLPGNVSITASSDINKTPLTSSSTTLSPPVPKPRTIQLVIQDCVTNDVQKLQEFSVTERHNTGSQVVYAEPAVATDMQKKSPENNSRGKTGVQKDTLNIGKIEEALQRSGTFREIKHEKTVGLHNDRVGLKLVAGTNVSSKSDVLITDTKAEGVNIPKNISKYVDPKILALIDCKLTPQIDIVAKESLVGTKPTKRVQTGYKFTQVLNGNSENSYSTGALDTVHSLKASTHIPFSAVHNHRMSKDIASDCTNRNISATHSQEGFTVARCTDVLPNTAKHNTHSIFQDLIPKARVSTHTPEKSLYIHLSDTHKKDWRSPMPERESRSLTPLLRTATPDGFLPDSRMQMPDPRSYTPDFRTPASDISDGYISSRTDSTFSTTSEEYYECSDSPFDDTVFEQAAYCNQGTKEDHASFTHSITASSPECINYNTKTDRNTSSSETQSSSSSSLLDKNIIKGGEEKHAENREEVDEMGLKLSVAERRTGADFRETERRVSEEPKSTADHVKQGKDLTDTDKVTEAEPQVPERKRLLTQSPVERLVDRGVTPEELTSKRAEPNRLSAGNLKPKKSSSEGEGPDKGKGVDVAALGPSSLERRGRPQSTRETEGQKLSHIPIRTRPGLQQERGMCFPFLQSRSSQPLSGARPSGSRHLSQAESQALYGSVQFLDNTSTRRPPTRPPPPGAEGGDGSAAGQKWAEVSHGLQNLLSLQPPAAQGRSKAGYLRPDPKPQASFLHAHSDVLQHHHPHFTNKMASAGDAHCQVEERSPFSITFSRMYSLKDLRDKISKLPTKSKRSSTSYAAEARKSKS